MSEDKRYHPLLIFYDIWNLVKSSIFFFLFLFVFKANSEFWLFEYGRYALIVIFVFILLYIPVRWYTSRYNLGKQNLRLHRKLFTTSSRTIPYAKIQHGSRKTTLFHRFFNMTSLTLEINTTGDQSSVTFHMLRPEEAAEIERHMRKKENTEDERPYTENGSKPEIEIFKKEEKHASYKVHFTPTKYDIFKAALTSFSFIAVIPIAWSLISNAEQMFQMEGKIEWVFTNILHSWPWWMILISLILLMLASVAAGGLLTFFRYGKYEIASDFKNIYITKGVLEQHSFTITKANVQAISVHQSLVKRGLGLAEVKLICAGGTDSEDLEVNTLYPFFPVKRAYAVIHEILPDYQITPEMERLPKKALWLRMLRPSWLWMTATAFLFYFEPDFFGIGAPWWMLSATILVFVIMSRLLSFFQSRYTMNGHYVQFKTGGFNTRLFVSKRSKITELQWTRNIIQQRFGLASIVMSNRAKPVKRTEMNDIPVEWCKDFHGWFMSREKVS